MVNRPTEEYALARVTMQQSLDALPDYLRIVAILYAAGYGASHLGAAFGTSKQAQSSYFYRALKQVRQ